MSTQTDRLNDYPHPLSKLIPIVGYAISVYSHSFRVLRNSHDIQHNLAVFLCIELGAHAVTDETVV